MNKKGAIIFAFLLVSVFAVLSSALLLRSVNESLLAKRAVKADQAFWLAEAGLQRVKYEKNTNNCHGMTRQDTGAACADCTCGGVTKVYAGTMAGLGDVQATLNASNIMIQSTGYAPSQASTSQVTRAVQGTFASVPIYDYGIFAKGTFFMANNASVDSYNSTEGDYVAANAYSHGNIATNGTTAGIVNMSNSALVKGDVAMGVGGTVVLNNSASITGAVSNGMNQSLPSVAVPASLTSLANSGALNLANSNTLTINTGNYKYSSIAISNTAKLIIDGDVTLYVTGNIAPANNTEIQIVNGGSLTIYTTGTVIMSNASKFNNIGKDPKKLTVYSTYGNGTGFALSNNTKFYGTVYMPDADYVGSNAAEIMGALVAKTVSLSNLHKIHYDEALRNTANPFGGVGTSVSSWQEI